MDSLIKTLDLYLVKKAPVLPKNIKEVIVNLAPWLEIVGLVLMVPGMFAMFGINAMMYGTPYGGYMMARSGFNYSLPAIFLIASFVLTLLAIPGLFNKTKMGWNYVFYSMLATALYSFLSGQLFGFVVGTIISLYLLFQVKSYYK